MTVEQEQLMACHQCDALFTRPELHCGQKARCTRCNATIYERKIRSIDRSFYLSIAGLLFLTPALLLPIMGVTLAGQFHQASLLGSIMALINKEYYLIALLVFLFAIAVPTVRLAGALYITYCFKFNKIKPILLHFFRSYYQLDTWSMLNVVLLGIVVSMYKLLDDTELTVNYGLLAFVLLLLCSTMVTVTLDQQYIWDKLERNTKHNNG